MLEARRRGHRRHRGVAPCPMVKSPCRTGARTPGMARRHVGNIGGRPVFGVYTGFYTRDQHLVMVGDGCRTTGIYVYVIPVRCPCRPPKGTERLILRGEADHETLHRRISQADSPRPKHRRMATEPACGMDPEPGFGRLTPKRSEAAACHRDGFKCF